MTVRTKLMLLAIGAMLLPLNATAVFLTLVVGPPGPEKALDGPFHELQQHQDSLPHFLAAAQGLTPTPVVLGRDGTFLSLASSEKTLGSLLKSGRERSQGSWKRSFTDLMSQSFEVGDYGPVHVVFFGPFGPSPGSGPGIDPGFLVLFTISFSLLLFIAGFGLLIANSLKSSLDRLGRSASRMAEGDLATPISVPRDEDTRPFAVTLEQLRHSLLVEQTRRARLIMGISHDFRTPLALIRGYADALKDRVAKDKATEERYVETIRDKVGQIESLVEDFLDYVRLEEDQYRGERPVVSAHQFLTELAEELRGDAQVVGRNFRVSIPDCRGTGIAIDTKAAGRAFRNLFTNAVRYSEPGGNISLVVEVEETRLRVSITDDGIGIKPEDLSSIYDPFFRGRNTGKTSGFGLGLAVVKSVVESHGWEIFCSSVPQALTEFTVVIPTVTLLVPSGTLPPPSA